MVNIDDQPLIYHCENLSKYSPIFSVLPSPLIPARYSINSAYSYSFMALLINFMQNSRVNQLSNSLVILSQQSLVEFIKSVFIPYNRASNLVQGENSFSVSCLRFCSSSSEMKLPISSFMMGSQKTELISCPKREFILCTKTLFEWNRSQQNTSKGKQTQRSSG